MEKVLIRYTYPGTVNGQPVGDVYVEACPWIAPDVYSYSKNPAEATHFAEGEADRLIYKWAHNGARVVPLAEATVL